MNENVELTEKFSFSEREKEYQKHILSKIIIMSNSANRKRKLGAYESPNEDRINEIIKLRRRSSENREEMNPLIDETKVSL